MSTPRRIRAPAASRPATAGGTRPVISSTTMASRTTIACLAPGPIGTAWRRTSSGESTTRTSGSASRSSSACHVPCSSRELPAASTVSFGPWSWSLRCTARTTRSPLGVTMPGKTVCPISAERGGITISARPERRLNRVAVTSAAESSARKARCRSAASARHGRGVAAHDQDVAFGQGRALERAAGVAGLRRHQADARIGRQIDGARHGAEIGRGRADPQLEDAVVERVVLDQCTRVLAEVGRDALAAAVGQQAGAEQQDDRHGAEQQRQADPGELEDSRTVPGRHRPRRRRPGRSPACR